MAIWINVFGVLIGAVLGAWGCYLWLNRRHGTADIMALRREAALYRAQVADHFADTAGLVNQMTDSYKAVFDHLQQGAVELLDEATLRERLLDRTDKMVILGRLGYRESDLSGNRSASHDDDE